MPLAFSLPFAFFNFPAAASSFVSSVNLTCFASASVGVNSEAGAAVGTGAGSVAGGAAGGAGASTGGVGGGGAASALGGVFYHLAILKLISSCLLKKFHTMSNMLLRESITTIIEAA